MAFVHLHNHTVFSMLDGATHVRIWSIIAVERLSPPWPLPTTASMYGVPDLALACDAVNHNTPEYKTWSPRPRPSPEKDRRDELRWAIPRKSRASMQYVKDMAGRKDEKGNIDELKPAPGHQAHLWLPRSARRTRTLARDHKPELYHMILLAKDQGCASTWLDGRRGRRAGLYYKPRVASTTCAAMQGHDLHERLYRGHHPQIHRPRRHGSAIKWAGPSVIPSSPVTSTSRSRNTASPPTTA